MKPTAPTDEGSDARGGRSCTDHIWIDSGRKDGRAVCGACHEFEPAIDWTAPATEVHDELVARYVAAHGNPDEYAAANEYADRLCATRLK